MPPALRLWQSLALAYGVAAQAPTPRVPWTCTPLQALLQLSPGATWQQLNCSTGLPGVPSFGPAGPVTVNLVTANLSSALGLRLLPLAAPAALSIAPINETAAADGRNILAGINGGYFYRVDVSSFFDGVCIGKSKADAEAPPSPSTPNTGLGDGSTVVNGTLLSSSCDCLGYNRPAILSVNGTSGTRIDLGEGAGLPPPAGLELDSLAAGPFLLSTNASGTFVAIPSDDQNFLNNLEHSANTGFGLDESRDSPLAFFVTVDGFDGCPSSDPTCGTNGYSLAYFLRDYLGATSAMGMDQGGSTTMWVKGEGVVSSTSSGGGGAPRPVFNGLFLLQE